MMEDDLKFETRYSKVELIQFVNEILPSFHEINFELTERTDTYYLQERRKGVFENDSYLLSFIMLQFTLKENENSTTLILSSQTKMISLMFRVLFIPLIWLFIFVISFSTSFLNIAFMVLGGVILTSIILMIDRKNKKNEIQFIEFIRTHLNKIKNEPIIM